MVISLDQDTFAPPVEVRFNLISEIYGALHLLLEASTPPGLEETAARLRDKVPPALMEEIKDVFLKDAPIWHSVLALEALSVDAWDAADWHDHLDRWRKADLRQIALPILETWATPENIQRESSQPDSLKRLASLFKDHGYPDEYSQYFLTSFTKVDEKGARTVDLFAKLIPLLQNEVRLALERCAEFKQQMDLLLGSASLIEIARRIFPSVHLDDQWIFRFPTLETSYDLKTFHRVIFAPSAFHPHNSFAVYNRNMVLIVRADMFEFTGPVLDASADLLLKAKALADKTNLRILKHLSRTRLCVKDLAQLIQIPQPYVSKHVQELRAANFVFDALRRKNRVFLGINYPEIEKTLQQVLEYLK
jgi:DNA-binding transcriptional ArsR family regulator